MLESVIRTDRLTRYFGSKAAVRDLTLNIPSGQVTALLGLNGAGKTTTIRILMGMLRPTRGRCEVFGQDTAQLTPETRMRIGYMVEGHFLYPGMRVRECAKFQRAGYSRWNDALFDQIVQHFGISQSTRVAELSRGQRAGVSIALVLAPDPELLVLDDPAMGLDPVSRRAFNETLVEFVADGKRTVLLSSHLLDDVERVSDRVILMANGLLQVDTTVDDIRDRVTGFVVETDVKEPHRVSAIPGLIEARHLGSRLHLTVVDVNHDTRAAINRLDTTSVESVELSFADSVLAWLSRTREQQSFLSRSRTKETA